MHFKESISAYCQLHVALRTRAGERNCAAHSFIRVLTRLCHRHIIAAASTLSGNPSSLRQLRHVTNTSPPHRRVIATSSTPHVYQSLTATSILEVHFIATSSNANTLHGCQSFSTMWEPLAATQPNDSGPADYAGNISLRVQ